MVRRTPKGEAGGSIPFWRAKKSARNRFSVCSGFLLWFLVVVYPKKMVGSKDAGDHILPGCINIKTHEILLSIFDIAHIDSLGYASKI